MRSLIFMATSIVFFGCSLACAQVRSTSPRNAPAMSSTIPTVGAGPRNVLGAIQLNLGALGPIPGSTIGTIMICPTTGIAAAMPSTTLDASNAVGATGMVSPQLPPGATPSAISTFGTSIMTAACNPAAAILDATEASGNSLASPIPGLATITGPAFSDATISSAATEAGGAGLSPEIVVPTPDSSPAP
jgi:hypothetical protein